jgi:hypothetical protein
MSFSGHLTTNKHTSQHITVMTTTRFHISPTTNQSYLIHNSTRAQHEERVLDRASVLWGVEGLDGEGLNVGTRSRGGQDHNGVENRINTSPSSTRYQGGIQLDPFGNLCGGESDLRACTGADMHICV